MYLKKILNFRGPDFMIGKAAEVKIKNVQKQKQGDKHTLYVS